MRYFKKLPNLPVVILPGRGRVFDLDILEGAEYAEYVPLYLYEVDEKGVALTVRSTVYQKPEPAPYSKVEVTHVSYPPRPSPTQALAEAWESRKPTYAAASSPSIEDALSLALTQTVPVPEEAPAAIDSPDLKIEATMGVTETTKGRRGRPRKIKPETPSIPEV